MHLVTELFSISALAGIVGVPVETIRTWERRYGVPEPERDPSGRRQYPLAEVERLRAVVQLVERGDRVRDLAGLDAGALAERLALRPGEPHSGPIRLVLVHPAPPPGLAGPGLSGPDAVEVVAAVTAPDDLAANLRADALVVHASLLGPDPAATLDALERRSNADAVLVIASFLPTATRRLLEGRGARLIDEGARADALRHRVEDAVLASRLTAGARPAPVLQVQPAFTRAELERLVNAPSPLPCECPTHLAGLILRLREFTRYSGTCADDTPEEASLHADLGAGSEEAAAILESLLRRVCAGR